MFPSPPIGVSPLIVIGVSLLVIGSLCTGLFTGDLIIQSHRSGLETTRWISSDLFGYGLISCGVGTLGEERCVYPGASKMGLTICEALQTGV